MKLQIDFEGNAIAQIATAEALRLDEWIKSETDPGTRHALMEVIIMDAIYTAAAHHRATAKAYRELAEETLATCIPKQMVAKQIEARATQGAGEK